ncbi:hypothetical protein TeGR_g9147 [Tetraparma gracilis]|uniref:RING-type domain-containing protein n=1 Tax=Tetraparma gracilis TaxID=2962635 RepID=A0ABQ6NDW6_9STRA|nr:hypothetical protein TeGR_g9147 [Tetraparma gracilis]
MFPAVSTGKRRSPFPETGDTPSTGDSDNSKRLRSLSFPASFAPSPPAPLSLQSHYGMSDTLTDTSPHKSSPAQSFPAPAYPYDPSTTLPFLRRAPQTSSPAGVARAPAHSPATITSPFPGRSCNVCALDLSATPLQPSCSYCAKAACGGCLRPCGVCGEGFCSFCLSRRWEGGGDYESCRDCDDERRAAEAEAAGGGGRGEDDMEVG